MKTYSSIINEDKLAELQSDQYLVHLGKGIDKQGYQLFRYPSDFEIMGIKEILKNLPLLRHIAAYLEDAAKTSEVEFLHDSTGNINWRNINKENFGKIFNILNKYQFIGADFVIINNTNSDIIE